MSAPTLDQASAVFVSVSRVRGRVRRAGGTLGLTLVSLSLLLAIWWLIARIVGPVILPDPVDVVRVLATEASQRQLLEALGETLPPLALALVLAMIVGAMLGIVIGLARRTGRVADPWIYIFWSTPVIALLPLLIVWFGIDTRAVVTFVFLNCVFPVVMNTKAGVRSVDHTLLEVARSLGARRTEVLTHVVLPSAVPHLLAGFRIAVGRSVVAVIVAQLFISSTGIGYMLKFYGETFQLSRYFAPLIATAAIGIALNGLADIAERRLLRWRPGHG